MRNVQADLIPGFRVRLDEVENIVLKHEKRVEQKKNVLQAGGSDRPASPDELVMRGPLNVRVRGPKVWVTLSVALIVLGVVAWSAAHIWDARQEMQTHHGR